MPQVLTSFAGAWTSLTLVGVTQSSGYKTCAVRLEMGDIVRFRGRMTNATGSAIASGTTLFTLPAAYRPTTQVSMGVTTSGAVAFNIATSGVVTLGSSLANSTAVLIDGLSFTLS